MIMKKNYKNFNENFKMQNIILIIFLIIICFVSFKYYIKIANTFKFLDTPNKLSNHKENIPTGAGLFFLCLLQLLILS